MQSLYVVQYMYVYEWMAKEEDKKMLPPPPFYSRPPPVYTRTSAADYSAYQSGA